MNLTVKPQKRTATLKARAKAPILLFGDVVAFYASLLIMLFIRYGEADIGSSIFFIHAIPFSLALVGWILFFYIGGLYEAQAFKNSWTVWRKFFSLLALGGVLLILLLYFVPQFGIAPKVNLFIFLGVYAAVGFAWRFGFNAALKLRSGGGKTRIVLVGDNAAADEVVQALSSNRQHDYEIAQRITHLDANHASQEHFISDLIKLGVSSIVIPARARYEPSTLRLLYAVFLSGIDVVRLADFYEEIFKRVPVAEIDEAWLLENISRSANSYQILGYFIEGVFALVLALLLLPIMIVVALLIALTSRGPVLYTQKRVGQYEAEFNLYKFRSMYADARNPDAGSASPTWSSKEDARVTPLGKFLRASHIDEFPQLFNILGGSMSFIGPRPERPEFTEKLEREIPYYELRSIMKPGITGWAQLNYPYGSSVEDAYHKLQYDIYYVKNRSLTLDLAILAKTLKKFFV